MSGQRELDCPGCCCRAAPPLPLAHLQTAPPAATYARNSPHPPGRLRCCCCCSLAARRASRSAALAARSCPVASLAAAFSAAAAARAALARSRSSALSTFPLSLASRAAARSRAAASRAAAFSAARLRASTSFSASRTARSRSRASARTRASAAAASALACRARARALGTGLNTRCSRASCVLRWNLPMLCKHQARGAAAIHLPAHLLLLLSLRLLLLVQALHSLNVQCGGPPRRWSSAPPPALQAGIHVKGWRPKVSRYPPAAAARKRARAGQRPRRPA